MSDSPIALAVIIGSVREGRFGPVVAEWFAAQARQHGEFRIDLVDPAEYPLPAVLPSSFEELVGLDRRTPEQLQLAERLATADAFVVVTPEYNHSFPASLKHLIDWHVTQWQVKPVGLVSYGGQGGGIRAAEHLRQVFAELRAVTIRDTISLDQHWTRFDGDGRLLNPAGPTGAAKTLLEQLAWWGAVLRDARQRGR